MVKLIYAVRMYVRHNMRFGIARLLLQYLHRFILNSLAKPCYYSFSLIRFSPVGSD